MTGVAEWAPILLAVAVFHFVAEADEIMDELRRTLAPGSYIALSTATTEGMPRDSPP